MNEQDWQSGELEQLISDTLSADAAPGIPTPIDVDLSRQRESIEPPFYVDDDELSENMDVDLPEVDAPSAATIQQTEDFASPVVPQGDAAELTVTPSSVVSDGSVDLELPDSGRQSIVQDAPELPAINPSVADVGEPYPWEPGSFNSSRIDEAIPVPQDMDSFQASDIPFVFPSAPAVVGPEQSRGDFNVNVDFTEHGEMMDEVVQRIRPEMDRVQDTYSNAIISAVDVETERIDRANSW